jgi:hypothetical protein
MNDNDETQVTEAAPAAALAAMSPRRRTSSMAKKRFVRTLVDLAHVKETAFDSPGLQRLLDDSDGEFETVRHQVIEAIERALRGEAQAATRFTHCPTCSATLEPPSLETQMANFQLWQRQRPRVYLWPESEMTRLRESLEIGDVIEPAYAMSMRIRKADGRVWLFERKK